MASTETDATSVSRPAGAQSVIPYLIVPGAAQFIEFLQHVFGAVERFRVPTEDGSRIMHAEVAVGDSVIELSDGGPGYSPRPTSVHVYVPDTDGVYERALSSGASPLHPVEEMPYGERSGSVRDPFGNDWYIATHHGPSHIPQDLRTVNLCFHLHGTDKMIEFFERAFGAEVLDVHREPESGPVRHANVRFGSTVIELGEAHGPYGPMPTGIHFYVADVDAAYNRAVAAGATAVHSPADKPYGERGAEIRDPAGNSWFLATPLPGSR